MTIPNLLTPSGRAICAASTLLAAALSSSVANANFTNGDFQTGDFTGWSGDIDGNPTTPPAAGQTPDFQIVDQAGDKLARIEADYYETPGDSTSAPQDQVIGANTLFQSLPTTVTPPATQLLLSFDWSFGGQTPSPDEIVQIGLVNPLVDPMNPGNFYDASGAVGFLVTATSYGSGTVNVYLSQAFNNAAGWTLDFQLNAGGDAYGSYLLIDNVQISQVPEPSTLFLFAPALALLARRRAHHRACA